MSDNVFRRLHSAGKKRLIYYFNIKLFQYKSTKLFEVKEIRTYVENSLSVPIDFFLSYVP